MLARDFGLPACFAPRSCIGPLHSICLPPRSPLFVTVFIYFSIIGAVGFLLYFFVGQASLLLPVGNGGGGGGAGDSVVMWSTYRAVHMAVGLVIMIPVLVVAFFPFMTHFQVIECAVQMLCLCVCA